MLPDFSFGGLFQGVRVQRPTEDVHLVDMHPVSQGTARGHGIHLGDAQQFAGLGPPGFFDAPPHLGQRGGPRFAGVVGELDGRGGSVHSHFPGHRRHAQREGGGGDQNGGFETLDGPDMALGVQPAAGDHLPAQPADPPVGAPEPGEVAPGKCEVEAVRGPDAQSPEPIRPGFAIAHGVIHGIGDGQWNARGARGFRMVRPEGLGQGLGRAVGGAFLLKLDEVRLVGEGNLALEVLQALDVSWLEPGGIETIPVKGAVLVAMPHQLLQPAQMQLVQAFPGQGFGVFVPEGGIPGALAEASGGFHGHGGAPVAAVGAAAAVSGLNFFRQAHSPSLRNAPPPAWTPRGQLGAGIHIRSISGGVSMATKPLPVLPEAVLTFPWPVVVMRPVCPGIPLKTLPLKAGHGASLAL